MPDRGVRLCPLEGVWRACLDGKGDKGAADPSPNIRYREGKDQGGVTGRGTPKDRGWAEAHDGVQEEKMSCSYLSRLFGVD